MSLPWLDRYYCKQENILIYPVLSVIRLRLPNDKIIKPGPSSEFFFLKKEGEESHARMSGMHVRMFHIYPQLAYEFHFNRWTTENVGSNTRNMQLQFSKFRSDRIRRSK
jgi:hypothetical protein